MVLKMPVEMISVLQRTVHVQRVAPWALLSDCDWVARERKQPYEDL